MFSKVKNFVSRHKGLTSAVTVGTSAMALAVPSFAETTTAPLVNVTADMLSPITESITSNLTTLLPVGITIMGIMIGVSLIPRIVYKFL